MNLQNDFQHRYITFTAKAKKDIQKLGTQFKRFGEVLTGIHIFLQNSAHRGELAKSFYLYQTQKQSETPSFEVYYTYDEKYVTVHHIRIASEDDDSLS